MNRLLILMALILVACISGCKGAGVAGECASTSSIRCLTERKCSYDATKNCMVCQCAEAMLPPQNPLDQSGRLPDPGVR